MAGIQHVVETIFRTVDRASAPMQGIAQASASARASLSGLMGPIAGVAGAIGSLGALHGLAELHSQAEDTRGVLAGMFQTFGQASSFNQGLDLARSTMEDINAAAAALPGEAQDYVNTFQAGFANFTAGFDGNIQRATEFSNRITAVASSLNVRAEEIASGVARLTQAGRGGAGQEVAVWQRLMPYITAYRQSQHQGALTAQTFNALTQQQRIELLRNVTTMDSMAGIITNAGRSWGALTGGLISATKMIAMQASAPLFDGAKEALQAINRLLMTEDGHLSATGRTIVKVGEYLSEFVVEQLREGVDYASYLGERIQAVGGRIATSQWFRQVAGIGEHLGGIASRLGQDANVQRAAVGAGARVALGPIGALVGPFMSMARDGDALDRVMRGLNEVFYQLTPLLEPLLRITSGINDVMGSMLAGVLPGLFDGLSFILGPIVSLATGLMSLVEIAGAQLAPMFGAVVRSLGGLASAFGEFMLPILAVLGEAILAIARRAMVYVVPALNMLMEAIRYVVEFVTDTLRRFGRSMAGTAQSRWGVDVSQSAVPEQQMNFMERIQRLLAQGNEQQARAQQANVSASRSQSAGTRGRHGTYNDFRNSRFDILQKFAEGYDPDRIAIAFTEDLARAAEVRLQSGLSPVFGSR